MKVIKLNTIDSTNSFLKELAQKNTANHFTVVVAKHQTKGKGQTHTKWTTEANKNLTFSVLVKKNIVESHKRFLNFAVSLAVHNWLKNYTVKNLSIKWPNDIMAGDKKIAGVLIENTLRGKQIYASIIGIGVNINQDFFADDLPNATSLKIITQKNYDLDALLASLLKSIQEKVDDFLHQKFNELENDYLNVLYKKDVPSLFINNAGKTFVGKITGVANNGNLLVETDNQLQEFGLKEISFA